MESLVQKAIEDITYRSKQFPKEAFRIITANREQVVPSLTEAIEKAILEMDDLDEDYQLHFYALHLLGEFQEKKSFPLIMKLVSLPRDVVDYLLGDTITSTLPDILYNTYNGDLQIVKRAIKDPDIDDYARGAMLRAMGQLLLDHELDGDDWKGFIKEIVYEDEEIGDYIYTEVASVICECHMVDMLQEIRHLYDAYLIEESSIGPYESSVDAMFEYEEYICRKPIDAADMLRGWSMFEQGAEQQFSEKDLKKLVRKLESEDTVHTTKIGRNDPCPCGSGKKYKKCCLNKPKSEVDLIESEQEKKKWMRHYPVVAKEREAGRIYLEDFFDAESIEIDKLIYLALNYRPHPIWNREPEETEEKRKRVYLYEAFMKFMEKAKKENINKFAEYDEKYSIHYRCEEWFENLMSVLKKSEDRDIYKEVSRCYKKMK